MKRISTLTTKTDIESLTILLDNLKQKLRVQATRLKRYTESNNRKIENKKFEESEKYFYKSIRNNNIEVTSPPDESDPTEFWKNIWSNPIEHNKEAPWIRKESQNEIEAQGENHHITEEEISTSIRKTGNWKAPGLDGIQNFWLKRLTNTHSKISEQFSKIILQPEKFPLFLTRGITYVLPKNSDTKNPANYRPITCLPTMYKLLTSIDLKPIFPFIQCFRQRV